MALNTWKARVKYEAIFFRVNVEEPLKFKENGEEDIVEVYVYHYVFVDRPDSKLYGGDTDEAVRVKEDCERITRLYRWKR